MSLIIDDRKQMRSGNWFSKWQKVKPVCPQKAMSMGNELVLGQKPRRAQELKTPAILEGRKELCKFV